MHYDFFGCNAREGWLKRASGKIQDAGKWGAQSGNDESFCEVIIGDESEMERGRGSNSNQQAVRVGDNVTLVGLTGVKSAYNHKRGVVIERHASSRKEVPVSRYIVSVDET